MWQVRTEVNFILNGKMRLASHTEKTRRWTALWLAPEHHICRDYSIIFHKYYINNHCCLPYSFKSIACFCYVSYSEQIIAYMCHSLSVRRCIYEERTNRRSSQGIIKRLHATCTSHRKCTAADNLSAAKKLQTLHMGIFLQYIALFVFFVHHILY